MAKRQRQFKRGTKHTITGPAKKQVRVRYEGTLKIGGKEKLVFQPLRKARKRRD